MIICPTCQTENMTLDSACIQCGFSPEKMDGFTAWAPELARENSGFKAHNFAKLAKIEADYFWFRSRNALIQWALKKYFPACQSLLEIGCGTGFVLSGIAKAFPHIRLAGSEIFTAGLSFAAERLPNARLAQMDARHMPYLEEFDVVAAFDVLEHIKEDEQALQSIYRAIKPGGGCLIAVPQHQWLWSYIDEEACHERRYSAEDLHQKLKRAGFEIIFSTSFVSLLLPLMMLSRLKGKNTDDDKSNHTLHLNPWLNRLLEMVLDFERWLIRIGITLPFGGSRLIAARKIKDLP